MSPEGRDKHLLVVAGGDHIRNGFGIPRRAFRRFATSYTIISGVEINVPPDKQDRLMNVTVPDFPMPPSDFLVYQAYEDLPQTGVRLGVAIENSSAGRGLVVKIVQPGSNAERIGLEIGDILLSLDGETLSDTFDLTYAVQQKHPGDKSVLQIERKGTPMRLEIVFKAKQEGGLHGKN